MISSCKSQPAMKVHAQTPRGKECRGMLNLLRALGACEESQRRAVFLFFTGAEPQPAPQGRGKPRREPRE
jgi:hypothetical protein